MSALPDLARKWSRALQAERGLKIDADDLALLAAIGVNDLLQTESARVQREQCQKRAMKLVPSFSTPEASTASNGTDDETEHSDRQTSRSLGMTKQRVATEAERAARRTSPRPRKLLTGSTFSASADKPSVPPVANLCDRRGVTS